MVEEQSPESDIWHWRILLETEMAFANARMNFLANCTDKIGIIRKALQDPSQRGTALRILFYMKIQERQELFDDLLRLASVGHADIALCRELILSLPREWVLSNIEQSAEPLLHQGTDEEYRRLLELYIDLDRDLARRLASRALQNSDPDIHEAGEDFIGQLRQE